MINLYDITNTDYEGNGDVILTPISGKVRQAAGGSYDLSMELPIDPDGKWQHIVPGSIVRVPVPKETIENAFVGQDVDIYKTNTEAALRESPSEPTTVTYAEWSANAVYSVGDKVTCSGINKNYKCTYFDGASGYAQVPPYNSSWWTEIPRRTSGASALATLPSGSQLYYVSTYDSTWYKMSTSYGLEGYIKKSQVTFWKHVTASEIQAHVITSQLFRLREPTINTEQKKISVTGQHVSYDLSGILIQDVSISDAIPAAAISKIVGGFMMDYAGEISTNITDNGNGTYTNEIKGKNGIYALLDPDQGIVKKFDAKLTRDNWDIFIMKKPDSSPVMTLAYGKNLKGVTWKQSSANMITRVVPVAKDENGNDLYLPEKWIDSPYTGSYPVVLMERLNVNGQVGKTKGTDDDTVWTEAALLEQMRTKAEERFSVDKVDHIALEITVQFEMQGNTFEYSWLKNLESVLLYDNIEVDISSLGLSETVEVIELEYDIVKEKITGLKLSNVNYIGRSVTGYNVSNNSISADKLMDSVAEDIIKQSVDKLSYYTESQGGSAVNTKYSLQSKVTSSVAPHAAATVTFDMPSGGSQILAIIPCSINANSNDNTLGVPTNLNFSTRTLTMRAIGTVTQSYTVQAWIIYI